MKNWIKHEGGKQPVPDGTMVEILTRFEAKTHEIPVHPSPAESMRWNHTGWEGDIVAYKIIT